MGNEIWKVWPPSIMITLRRGFITIINHHMEDVVIWCPFRNGIYSSSLAFKWLTNEKQSYISLFENWSCIWKQKLTENILHFLWLTFHGSLPINNFCVYRHLSTNSSCHKCPMVKRQQFICSKIVP